MSVSSINILTNQVHPNNSSVLSLTSEKFKGDGFYNRSDGLHTVQYNLNEFVGEITLQATLAVNPLTVDWFDVANANLVSTGTQSDNSTGAFIKNFIGNYVWIRVQINTWSNGNILSILLNH